MNDGARPNGRRTRHLALGALLACACAGAAGAQGQSEQPALPDIFRMPETVAPETVAPETTAPAPDSLEGLVVALGAPTFGEREAASEALRERAADLQAALERGRIRADDLSAEQRKRVADVVEGHFYETPRAALGVQFAQMNPAGNGVALQMVLGDFPSARVLAPGDAILEAEGVPLAEMPANRAMELLRAMIIARAPGETLPMTVQRAGARLEVEVELGDFRDLGNGAAPQELDLLRAWEMRARTIGLSDRWDGRVETGLSRRDWPVQRRAQRIDPSSSIFVGGASQAADIQLLAMGLSLRQRDPAGVVERNPGQLPGPGDRTLDERRAELRSQIEQLQILAQVTEQRANDLIAGEAQRRESAMRLVQIQARIAEIRNELERLERR